MSYINFLQAEKVKVRNELVELVNKLNEVRQILFPLEEKYKEKKTLYEHLDRELAERDGRLQVITSTKKKVTKPKLTKAQIKELIAYAEELNEKGGG